MIVLLKFRTTYTCRIQNFGCRLLANDTQRESNNCKWTAHNSINERMFYTRGSYHPVEDRTNSIITVSRTGILRRSYLSQYPRFVTDGFGKIYPRQSQGTALVEPHGLRPLLLLCHRSFVRSSMVWKYIYIAAIKLKMITK